MDDLHGVRVAGPLALYARGFAAELARLGYSSWWAQRQLRLAAHLGGWLDAAGLDAAALDAAAIGAYVAARRAAGHGEFVTPGGLALLLGYLRGLGVVPPEASAPQTLSGELLAGYGRWLLAELSSSSSAKAGGAETSGGGTTPSPRRYPSSSASALGVTNSPYRAARRAAT